MVSWTLAISAVYMKERGPVRAGNLLMIQTIAKVEQDLNQAARHEPLSIFPDFSVSVCLSHLSVSVSLFLSFSISLSVSLQTKDYLT